MIDERRMNNVGTNTSDVVVEPNGDRLRTSTVEANACTSIPIVDVLLTSGHEDHIKIPHVNLSITGYEPDSLRTLVGMGSPSMRTQEISMIPQLYGPRSLPMREPNRGQMNEVPRLVELDSSQGGTYVQRASATRRREYPAGDSNDEVLEGCTEIGDPLREGDIQTKVEDPLTKEDTLIEDPLVMKDPLEEDIFIEMEDPLEEEDTLAEDPLM